MFRISKKEWETLRFQIGTSKQGRGGRRYTPHVFTEQGIAMLSSVLKSRQAVAVNIGIMRTFVRLRQSLSSHEKLTKALTELRDFVLKRSTKTDREFHRVWLAMERLIGASAADEKKRHKIGFDVGV